MNLGRVLSTLAGGAIAGGDNNLERILAGLAGSSGQSETDILSTVLSVIQQQGGVGSLLTLFSENDLQSKSASWVGQGPNEDLEPDQVQQVLGSSVVNAIAARLGVEPGKAGSIIAAVLPELINRITPGGSVSGEQDDIIAKGLSLLGRL